MLGLNLGRLLGGLLAVSCAMAAVWLTLDHLMPPPPKRITIAAGTKGGAFEFFANRYREILARDHVILDVRSTDGIGANLKLLQDPRSGVDAAFVQGGISNSSRAPGLESLGRVNYLVFFIFYRATETLTDLPQLKGKRIAVGPLTSGTHDVAEKILKAGGVNSSNTTLLLLGGRAAVDALDAGRADVLFMGTVLDAPLIQSLLRDPGIRLMSLPRAKALTRKFPFLSRLELPSGVVDFENNVPPTDVTLIGTTDSVLVRADVHPEIVGLLARALQEVHSDPGVFQQFGEFPTQADPEFPMAESARDFYRDGPSLLHRYLPFWLATYVRRFLAILVTVVAIVVPVFSYAPKLYQMFLRRHIMKLYRELRVLEADMQSGLPASQLLACQGDLERIDRATRSLPMRHSDLFFELRTQIDLTRAQLDAIVARSKGAPDLVRSYGRRGQEKE